MRSPLIALVALAATTVAAHAVTISGRVLGTGGKPVRGSRVMLRNPYVQNLHDMLETAADGTYRFTTDHRGSYRLCFSAPNHEESWRYIYLDGSQDIVLDVRLGTPRIPDTILTVSVIGDFNMFDESTALPLARRTDGTYAGTFPTHKARSAGCMLLVRGPVAGMDTTIRLTNPADSVFAVNQRGIYRSLVIPRDGVAEVIFDPRSLPPASVPAEFRFDDARHATLSDIIGDIVERRDVLDTLTDENLAAYWAHEIPALEQRIASATDTLERWALLAEYVGLHQFRAPNLNPETARRALAEIPPESEVWSIQIGNITRAALLAGRSNETEEQWWRLVGRRGDTLEIVQEMAAMLNAINYDREPDRYMRFYSYLADTVRFPASGHDAHGANFVRRQFAPGNVLLAGRRVPEFSVALLDNPGRSISNTDLKGRYYLIDFWATWCGPCVAEMDNLHNVYRKYQDRGFTIVSVSIDRDTAQVQQFRARKWPMPWHNACIVEGYRNELVKRFNVMGVPTPILVDAEGIIVATETDLRGHNLNETLARVLGPAPQGPAGRREDH